MIDNQLNPFNRQSYVKLQGSIDYKNATMGKKKYSSLSFDDVKLDDDLPVQMDKNL